MVSESVSRYITERYPRWRDYAEYQAARAGIPEDADDILNEVMLSFLQKDNQELERLFSRKRESYSHADQVYTELDYFVLKMIKLNATSLTAPWRFKSKSLPTDENVTWSDLEIEDLGPDGEDSQEEQLQKWRAAREILDSLEISDQEKKIFTWKAFADNPLASWPGPESYTAVCYIFNRTRELVSYSAQLSNENQVKKLSLRLLKACINERNEEFRNRDLRIRRFSKTMVQVTQDIKVRRFAENLLLVRSSILS